MYDEGAAQVSYATPGLDSGASGAEVEVPQPGTGGHGGKAYGSGCTGEGAVRQSGVPLRREEGGGRAGEGAMMQHQHAGGAGNDVVEELVGREDGAAVLQEQEGGDVAVGSGPGSGAC
ncbi:hypothetical protein Vafri_4372 [Volvox africanus]|nr:hypothetical protein Vafri_4372 [Volvox africanus]